MTTILEQLINSSLLLNKDEYLEFLIQTHFKHYINKNIFLSIYDFNKKFKMATNLSRNTFNLDNLVLQNLLIYEMPHLQTHQHIIKVIDEVLDYVLQTANPAIYIVFDKFQNLFGAVHVRCDPIFTPQNEVCGVSFRAYDFTKLYFGAFSIPDNSQKHTSQKKNIEIKYDSFSEREKHILFLLAINFTQEVIADTLQITRGTVAKTISRICNKLKLNYTSATYLINHLDKTEILFNLTLPKSMIKPCIIKITDIISKTSVK